MDFSTGLDVLVLGLTIVSKPDDLNAYFQVRRETFLADSLFLAISFLSLFSPFLLVAVSSSKGSDARKHDYHIPF